MTASQETVDVLKMPEVRSYLINMFDMAKSAEQSYERLLAFFTRQRDLEQKAALLGLNIPENERDPRALVSAAGQILGIWDPEHLLSETQASVRKGLKRISVCQHKHGDGAGGWGYDWEVTGAWATAYALLALEAGRQLDVAPDPGQLEKGFSWLMNNYEKWSLAHIPSAAWVSIYEASLVVRCFLSCERDFPAVNMSLHEMQIRQNADGGWNPAFPGRGVTNPMTLVSEVGATSMAIQAFAATGGPEYLPSIQAGLEWMVEIQQPDGCWISGPNDKTPNQPSLSKTCDAVSGIAAARRAGVGRDCSQQIVKAVNWITSQEKFLSSSSGWGYDQVQEKDRSSDLVSTCLVLEALVETEEIAFPVIAPYVRLLITNQSVNPGNLIDGAWEKGDTFRITLALIQFWAKLKASQTSTEAQLAPAINTQR